MYLIPVAINDFARGGMKEAANGHSSAGASSG